MQDTQDFEQIHKLWIKLDSNNSLLDVWNGATEHIIKKYSIDCTLFYREKVSKGYATEMELNRLAERINIREENLLDFLTEEYHRIFISLAHEVLIPENTSTMQEPE